ncbi:alpha-L-fucosidase [Opitutus terrae]|uniref:alpha-L-fucosidase n=1 Tax=Opitutus terrae (strain DSM 11246 / JCM 15787 / PB90-1) TaxID=452637 RepID=B1ZN47_OPITP|nr:alpha-L-fucosidase [Opitutus terrae]ACB76498.1 Alpha-L-fucosidase [Opitutus terrae PB90-1]
MKTFRLLAAIWLLPACGFAQTAPAPYQPSFESLERANPAPEWFKDAKFGIYFHWGVYSVPAFGNEWYPRTMYLDGTAEHRHHVERYGDPREWPYHNFIVGARDKEGRFVQFAPKLKSAGGHFDPAEWAQLFADAGAKFAGPVAEHHDGFSMWASKVNPWNAKDQGPKLDLVGLFTEAIRARGLRTVLSMHHAYNITGFYEGVPPQQDPKLQILYGQQGKERNEALWLAKHKEIIDGYRPDIIWQDFNLHKISPSVLLEFLAYYYNQAAGWKKEVVATYKDGLNPRCAVLDYERGGPADTVEKYWLTDDAISSSSWSYTEGISYYSTKQILHGFIDRISKNGNLLLNVSPRADGTIPQEQKNLLLTMGGWLKKYGEAVYATRAWDLYGEGPTKMGAAHGVMGPPREGTAQDVRYTRAKDNSTLYAILLGWPDGQSEFVLRALSSERIDGRRLKSVALINGRAGAYLPLEHTQDAQGLRVRLPARPFDELAYVLKLDFAGGIPAFDNFAAFEGAEFYHLVPGSDSGDLVLGADLTLTTARKAPANQWKVEHLGKGVHRLLNREDPRTALAWDGTRRIFVRVAVTGADTQLWKIARAPGGLVTLANVSDPTARLSLSAAPAAGIGAALAPAADPLLARWQLREVCDTPQQAFKPHALPGVVEAEDFDVGCPGDAYRDRDEINEGGQYRPDQGVDLGECSAGGYTLGWTHAGEWTAYTVTVDASASYGVSFHVATGNPGAKFHLESDGVDLTGTIDVPNTKGFQNWTNVKHTIHLDAGQHVLKVVIDGDYVNLDKMDFEKSE